jgi:nitrous oxidase accessory protein
MGKLRLGLFVNCDRSQTPIVRQKLKQLWLLASLLAAILLPGVSYCLPPLQLFIELTPPGGVLRPPPGSYSGPVVISRPLTLDGGGQVTIDAEGSGTVLSIKADGVVVRGVHLTNSGESHNDVDAGLLLAANDALIENNVIDNVLFGIHLRQANDSTIRGNRISSKPFTTGLRGDGIRLWYSNDNLIEGNTLLKVRDIIITNSADNRITGNSIQESRVGIQFVFSPGNLVEKNIISNNETGLVILYSNDLVIRSNHLEHMRSFAGSALALKESSNVVITENEILHCAIGVGANAPTHPENIYHLKQNRFAYNDIALYFYGENGGHIIHNNRFENNLVPVAVSAPMSARANEWRGNYWDRYEGFDLDHDGIGDTEHNIYLYSDRIWMDRPMTRFFRGSTLLELIDFIERLAPFSEPDLILTDPNPRIDSIPPQRTVNTSS